MDTGGEATSEGTGTDEETSAGRTDAGAETLPADVVDDVERLTRLERSTRDDHEAAQYAERVDDLLSAHGFTARIREDDGGDVLVCHPDSWLADGVVHPGRIDDVSRAVEIPLEGTEDPDDWTTVDTHNRDLASAVREAHGDVHGANAAALADFVSNHYAKEIESLSGPELREFREEYFVRNAWPSDRQRSAIDESIRLVFEVADVPVPEYDR
ncbi:rnhA operon protein [Natrarchaeobaculum aegyptiacum]|uniref:RnhA operon protein n=1 Tax=Natrarchaeobaculum aegyptiacum TaxID=745377 RepID=A0A2Z2I3F6_9EURY|nr:rnhA operon protein [Natrarchaeobaculum aegyptiacum]